MKARGSIIRRLLGASILALPLFLGITGYAIDQAHTRSLIAAQESQLQLQFYGILGVMEWSNTQPISVDRLREPRFWQFRSGLYAFIHTRNGTLQWQSSSANSLEVLQEAFSPTAAGEEVFDEITLKDTAYFRYRYHVIWEDETGVEYPLIFTLLEHQDAFRQELLSFRKNIALWLGLAAVVLLVMQVLVLRWGLRPLRDMSRELRALEAGERESLGGTYPLELTGVTHNLNRLLEKEQQQRERYRNTLGNLAHSLKTPLSVMRSATNSETDPQITEQLDKMNNIIDYQLQRAVSAGPRRLGTKTPLKPMLERLCQTLTKVYRDSNLDFAIDCADTQALAMDEQDLMELLGNLIDNACKAAESRVAINVSPLNGSKLEVSVEDDGPGFPEDKIDALMERGNRGDQYGSGQGLGLAVAVDILNAYEAGMDIERSVLGGAKVRLALPA
ncbi:two-component system sensor histidine kinase PhoQ [Litorivivens lipolytica]|uniref:histidine kinase n=1 Tax=Litorivivens lipolytica TaxID=1524264 RepID=A0A7W4W2F9_9GAMM|nr:ATP-binding protein [Litorivivens lipolytica]MBB3046164.1 two-component system sensor histidine kinase PhoQ [Litorivivens lipolytica]